jgi:hypothetical protein
MKRNSRRFTIFLLQFLAVVSSLGLTIIVEHDKVKPFQATQRFFESLVQHELSIVFVGVRFLVICLINWSVMKLIINYLIRPENS